MRGARSTALQERIDSQP